MEIHNINEKLDSIKSFAIGGMAITLPSVVNTLSTTLQILTMAGGFIIIVFRIIHEYRKYKENKS